MLEVQLLQMDGKKQVAHYAVQGKKFLIGRHDLCQLKLDHKTVSKTHCAILQRANQVLITDLGSRAGTLVNGTELSLAETAPLQHDDRIKLASWSGNVAWQSNAMSTPHLSS